jgi:hypothetical protein
MIRAYSFSVDLAAKKSVKAGKGKTSFLVL